MITGHEEILFIYDVKNANPNGDPADENKPRIDEETGYNIVTDVRLKRTIRDYLFTSKGYNGENNKDIFVRQTASKKKAGGIKDGKARAGDFGNDAGIILTKCIDIRLFGGVIPLSGASITFTGPVQFKMGKSLHRVKLQYIKGTGAFASADGDKQNTFREEYILPYSLIAFYGIVNMNTARITHLTETDLEEFYESIWMGTKNLITRSKFEHTPRLLITIKYSDENFFIGELDKYIEFNSKMDDEKIRDINDGELNISVLKGVLAKYIDRIKSINIRKDRRLNLGDWSISKSNIYEE
ncbi:MAG: type I-B CRISPR-associated protein Cas7/Csh2 [Spirochaetales bacterium]|nr:type I-B CRISPR-associated protein Cas7/Csh2 [Spirochaetales bacterium]